jgi:signal recognition particle subunit SRP54
MGGMEGLMGMLPGVQKMKKQIAESGISDKTLERQLAIISSMTKAERKKPDVLQASRKRRIAAGAGVEVAEVNRVLKQHRQMADAFKMMSKDGGKGFARMASMLGGPGGMGGGMGGGPGGLDLSKLKAMGGGKMPTPEQIEEAAAKLPGLGGPGGLKLPGLGGLPPGFNPFKK